MKRTIVLCVLSGLLGVALAVALADRWDPWSRQAASAPPDASAPALSDPTLAVPAQAPGTLAQGYPSFALPPPGEFTPEERVNMAVYEKVNRGVVHITTQAVRTDGFFLFDTISEGEGSGVVLDQHGHILTNFHVIDAARLIQVALFNGKTYDARLVGSDASSDVAVLRIEAPPEELFPVTFGESTRLCVGQRVFAIGNPFGLERTLTTGIISSLNRSLPSRKGGRTIKQIIQIDAAINPGSSGGPLLDSHGLMIGMNTAIASKTGESAGVGFAIPVNTIARVVPQLIAHGRVVRADAGILRVFQTDRGLLIAALAPNGAAARAGLQGPKIIRRTRRQGPFITEQTTIDRAAADLIVGIDGQPVRTADDFLTILDAKQPGERITIEVLREGRRLAIPLVLDAGE